MADHSLDIGAAGVVATGAPRRTAASVAKGTLVLVAAMAIAAILNEAADFVQDRGWVSSVSDGYRLVGTLLVAAVATLTAESIGVLRNVATPRQRYLFEFAVIAGFVALVATAYAARDPGRIQLSGELTERSPAFAHSITEVGRSGDRFQISVRPLDDDLVAQLIVSRGVQSYTAEMAEDRTITFDRVLVGDRWRATVKARDHSSGRFALEIEAHRVEDVAVPSSFVTSLADAKASQGYVLELPESRNVYIGIRPNTPADFRPSLDVRDVRNLSRVYTQRAGSGWDVFERLAAGRYVIVVHESAGRTGTFELTLATSRPGPHPAAGFTTPTPGARPVPDVYGLAVTDAEEALSAAGLSPVVVDVCSSSVPKGYVRQVYVAGSRGQEQVVIDAPARKVPRSTVPAGSTVYVNVGTGLPCS